MTAAAKLKKKNEPKSAGAERMRKMRDMKAQGLRCFQFWAQAAPR